MDFGILFRQRTIAAQKFLKLLQNRDHFYEGESSIDIVLSYIAGLLVSKALATPLEVSQIIAHVLGRKNPDVLRGVLRAFLLDPARRGVLWSGWLVDLFTWLPDLAVENIAFRLIKRHIPDKYDLTGRVPRKEWNWGACLASKLLATLVSYPGAVMRTRAVMRSFGSPPGDWRSCVADVYAGARLGCGLLPALVRVVLFIGLKEFYYRNLRQLDKRHSRRSFGSDSEDELGFSVEPPPDETQISKHLMLDYLSGALAECVLFPLTVIIHKMQASRPGGPGFFQLFRATWRDEGVRGLLGGFGAHVGDICLIYFGAGLVFTITRGIIQRVNRLLASARTDFDD
eukprot:TRINITY_DN3888_c0_g1_i1.p1 TRINITY_DN3888_c0_g1~~TRINITY_DN3888_c0_g1_i1.p1  ORF type:complete len:342 (+),score=80.80 TRINITY_DN3888_c0_g1_i1:503-1528(+)